MDEKTAAVYNKFRNENWNKMNASERLEALQQLEIISAEKNHSCPQKITAKELEGAVYGYFDGTEIVVNKYILENGMMIKNVQDEETGEMEQLSYRIQDANIQMMDTIFHEDYHSFQEQAVNGEIPMETLEAMGVTKEILRDWQANNTVLNYVDPEVDGCLYRIQELERTAFQAGESNTKEAFVYLNAKYGEEPNFGKYMQSIENSNYSKNLNMAQMRYGDVDIVDTLQKKMNERYYQEEVQYSNAYSAEDVETVLNKSMNQAMSQKMEVRNDRGIKEAEEKAGGRKKAEAMAKDHTPGGFNRESGYKSDLEIAEERGSRINTSFGSKNHNVYVHNSEGTHEHFWYDPEKMQSGYHGENVATHSNHPKLASTGNGKGEKSALGNSNHGGFGKNGASASLGNGSKGVDSSGVKNGSGTSAVSLGNGGSAASIGGGNGNGTGGIGSGSAGEGTGSTNGTGHSGGME